MKKLRRRQKQDEGAFEPVPLRKMAAIVPPHSIAGRALVVVLGIMCFLACLSVVAVAMVAESAADWQRGIAREVTIQIRPIENVDTDNEIAKAVQIARKTPGIVSVRVLSKQENERLLEPWLGSNLGLENLPVPRLLLLDVDRTQSPDFVGLAAELKAQIKGASFDDHRQWRERLSLMTGSVVAIGVLILLLVLTAATLSVIFSTRAAMAANRDIVNVLNLVGAEDSYIARSFQRRFLQLGLEGGVFGGLAALVAFPLTDYLIRFAFGAAGEQQLDVFMGDMRLSLSSMAAIVFTILAIAFIAALTSRITVRLYLKEHS